MFNKIIDFYERHELGIFNFTLGVIVGYVLFCVWMIFDTMVICGK